MIPTQWRCVVFACVIGASGCEPAAKAPAGASGDVAATKEGSNAADAKALWDAAECEEGGTSGWCAASRWDVGSAGVLRPGATWLGVRATVRGARVEFSESAWMLSVRGGAAGGPSVGVRELGVLDERVRRGLARQTLAVAKGVREEVVMETPAVAAALRAAPPSPMTPTRATKGWRLGEVELRSVAEGTWMAREVTRDGVIEWTLWVDAPLKRPDEVERGGDTVPLEKLSTRYACDEEQEGVKARACEVIARYAGATEPLAEGEYAGWFVRPAGGERGSWSARVEGGKASLAQDSLEASQGVSMSGPMFEVEAAFEGREREPITVWARSEEGGGWAIARSKTSGAVWFGRLKPLTK